VKLGGATGHKAFARDLGVLIRPQEVLKVVVALVRVYIANGNRTDRKHARLKHLLEIWSLDQYLAETEKLLGCQLFRAPLDSAGKSPLETELIGLRKSTRILCLSAKKAGFSYYGVALPVGQITRKQLLRLADLVDNYGSGDLRLTVGKTCCSQHSERLRRNGSKALVDGA
jgi:ferredoxin-nitrite reductase